MLFTLQGTRARASPCFPCAPGEWRTLEKAIGGARYLPSGHLLFARLEGLVASAVRPGEARDDGRARSGAGRRLHDSRHVRESDWRRLPCPTTDVLVYLAGGAEAGENRLVWVDRDGRTRPACSDPVPTNGLGFPPTAGGWRSPSGQRTGRWTSGSWTSSASPQPADIQRKRHPARLDARREADRVRSAVAVRCGQPVRTAADGSGEPDTAPGW